MRKLYYVSITLHSLEEIGSSAQPVLEREEQHYDPQAKEIYRENVEKFWQAIREEMIDNKINTPETCQKLHIYFDGLQAQSNYYCKECFKKTKKQYFMEEIGDGQIQCPQCDRRIGPKESHIPELVKLNIDEKLPQYLIIEKLIEKGAIVHGTDSLPLLLQEIQRLDQTRGIAPTQQEKDLLLKQRDEFIAKQINRTLPENEIGLLFTGAYHHVDQELKKISDIKVIYLQGGQ
ncbi:hypothetical protein MYX07_04535 [Patescibacteria group bacterium AH-259-L07]|nr:hypothetical protein [Patescibacteria group bacterium AH-259-L07]